MRDVDYVRDLADRRSPGLVNFVPALACHFCLDLPAAFTQPGDHLLAEPSIYSKQQTLLWEKRFSYSVASYTALPFSPIHLSAHSWHHL